MGGFFILTDKQNKVVGWYAQPKYVKKVHRSLYVNSTVQTL